MTIFLTVTAKGQVTSHKELLAHLGVRPGQRLDVVGRVVKITTDTTALVRALVRDVLDLASRSRRRWSKPWKLHTRWKQAKDKTRNQCYQASIKMGNKKLMQSGRLRS